MCVYGLYVCTGAFVRMRGVCLCVHARASARLRARVCFLSLT